MEMNSILKDYVNTIRQFPILSREEETALFEKSLKGDKVAREKIINSNLRLVLSIANKYQARNLTLMDLVQEGNMGLMVAVDKFDLSLGYKFSTYATNWIKQAISKALNDKDTTIRVPVYMREKIATMKKIERQLESKGITPTNELLAKEMKESIETITNIQSAYRDCIVKSIDTPLSNETDDTIEETLADTKETPAEEMEKSDSAKTIERVIDRVLTPREKQVIVRRFGLNGEEPRTLESIGEELGISRERARQLEEQAKSKLRKEKEIRDLM